jgi:hypothetical protein
MYEALTANGVRTAACEFWVLPVAQAARPAPATAAAVLPMNFLLSMTMSPEFSQTAGAAMMPQMGSYRLQLTFT